MMKVVVGIFAAALASVTFGHAQPSHPAFEVASIKLNPGCATQPRGGQGISPGRLTLECVTLRNAIENAYGVWANGVSPNPKRLDVQDGPGWIGADYFAILATAEGKLSIGQMNGPMLQALLEERFKLKLHRESKEAPVYTLTVTKNGLKVKHAEEGRCVQADLDRLPPPPKPGEPLPVFCGRPIPGTNSRNVTMDAFGMSMADFGDGLLSRILDRVVIDKTGQNGLFDFHLEFTPDDVTPLGARPVPAPPAGQLGLSIFTALQEQLGLKLESGKGPVEVLVIDHVERPSEN